MEYITSITVIGLAALGMAWMPAISGKIKVSYSLIYVLSGMLLYSIVPGSLSVPDPFLYQKETLHLTELTVIVSIMGTGLKIDQPFSFRSWKIPFRLVLVTMILCIAIVSFVAWRFFGLDLASSLLLGAVLAPTDPVLASDVQVGPPHEKEQDKVKFTLTAEAGMNDGTAFPFTWLAVTAALLMAGDHEASYLSWLAKDLFYRIIVGVVTGFLLGRLLGYLIFNLTEKKRWLEVNDGFIAISATLFVYGLCELLSGYGFIAVFVTAITLRNYEMNHKFHKKLHSFAEQIERILVAIVLLLFGGSLVNGLLDYLTWPLALFGLMFLLIIRPLTGMLTMTGTPLHNKEKWAISFFGIRGIGSFFYLSFALEQAKFVYAREVWSLVAFIVLISIVIHGLSASTVMKKLENNA